MSRRCALIVVAGLLASIAAAAPSSAGTPSRPLPPDDLDVIAAVFDPVLERLGLRTTRAGLQATDDYRPDPKGRHLAVYVEPTGEYTDAQFVTNFTEVAKVYLPKVFKRWKRLKSFDVCQEPLPAEDDRAAPPPVTQLFVDRRSASVVDWEDASLADLLDVARAHEDGPGKFSVFFAARLMDDPAYAAAQAEAGTSPASGAYER